MQSLTAIVAGVKSHWPTILFFAAWWIAVGKVLASRWPQPAATEPRWDRALHFALVNLPAFAASKLDGQTFRLLGIPFPVSLPVVGWTARARETKPDNAGPIKLGGGGALLMLLIPALLANGCATAGMSAKAPLAVKLQADEAVMKKIVDDVKTQCGPQFASAAPIVAGILAIAANPTNALNDLTNAISMIPALVQDGKAMHCVYATVSADLKAAGFHAQWIDLDALQERLATIRQREIDQYARAYRRFMRLSAAAR